MRPGLPGPTPTTALATGPARHDPLGATRRLEYDGLNRLIREINPLGQVTRHVYDDDLTDGAGLDSVYRSFIAPLGFGDNADGMAIESTNAVGERTVSVRDGAGRSILEINPAATPPPSPTTRWWGGCARRLSPTRSAT